MGSHPDLDDVVQEALVRAWRHAGTCQAEDPTAWVLAITRREVWRRRSQASVTPEDMEEGSHEFDVDRHHVGVDTRKALKALLPRERLLLYLRYELDLTQPAIAALLGMPEGTTKVQLHRARQRLRDQISDE